MWNDSSDAARLEITTEYEARPDVHELFSTGIREVLGRRMTALEVRQGGQLVRRYELSYGAAVIPELASIRMVGADGITSLPSLSFEYTQPSFATDGQIVTMTSPPSRSPGEADVDLADLNGDTLPDLLVAVAGQYRSYVNLDGTTWAPAETWATANSPSASLSMAGAQLADVNGDGAADLLVKSGTTDFRYFSGLNATSFGPAVSIPTVPNFLFEDPDVRLADMDGDRRVDVAITTTTGLSIGYNVKGTDWTIPEPVGVVDSSESVRFSDGRTDVCDVNGDRVSDICTLRSGVLVYWLGRGRGRFEAARVGSGVPAFDISDPWRLVDLNGDGWVDLVHVGVGTVQYALASAAGVFEGPRTINGTPAKSASTAIEFADMNGSGTTRHSLGRHVARFERVVALSRTVLERPRRLASKNRQRARPDDVNRV